MWSPRQVTPTHFQCRLVDLLLPLAQTPDRRDQRLLVSHPKDTDILSYTICVSISNVESQVFKPNNARRLARFSKPGWPRDKRAC